MARITIIVESGYVRDGELALDGVDVSSAPAGLHALQWYDTKGELEYANLEDGTKPQNEFISELPDWVNACIANMPARQEQINIENQKIIQSMIDAQTKQ